MKTPSILVLLIIDDNATALFKELAKQPHLFSSRDTSGRTLLHNAVSMGRLEIAERLIELKPSLLNVKYSGGFSTMHDASRAGNTKIIEMLVRFGSCMLETHDPRGCTPMSEATALKRLSTIMTLHYLGVPFCTRKRIAIYDEQEAADIRYRVYFQDSLMKRVFFQLQKNACTLNFKKTRFLQ